MTAANRSSGVQLWLIGALLPVALLASANSSGDFPILWSAARQVLAGQAARAYDPALVGMFPYPPHLLFALAPFALLSKNVAYVAFMASSALFFALAARPYLPPRLSPMLPILTPAALFCFHFGQTGLFVGALWLLAFRGSLASVAMLTVKPHLGALAVLSLPSPLAWLKTAAIVAVLVAFSLAVFGWESWAGFLRNTVQQGQQINRLEAWLLMSVSPATAYGLIGWAAYAAGALVLLRREINVFTAATAALLISPYGFHYDMTVACLGFGLLILRHWDDMPLSHRLPVALAFLSPTLVIAGSYLIPPILLWALAVQTRYPLPAQPGWPVAASRSPLSSP